MDLRSQMSDVSWIGLPRSEIRHPRSIHFAITALLVFTTLVAPMRAQAFAMRDMVGRELRLPTSPQRIISLVPSVTEVIFALGGEEKLVGVTDYCDFPPAAKQKPKVGSMLSPSLEVIVSSRPDVVIATDSGNRKETMAEIERLGIPVFIVNPNSLQELMIAIGKLGELTGRDAAVSPLIAGLTRRIDAVASAVRSYPRPKVLYVLWPDPLIVPGRGSHLSELIELAGGTSVTSDDPQAHPRYSLEAAIVKAPEVIVLASHSNGVAPHSRWRWGSLAVPAAQSGRIYTVDGSILHRVAPRLIDGLEQLARLLHPEAFR
jgi:iron complex transport system substrate-binding protein